MKYRRKNTSSNENEVTEANPIPLPKVDSTKTDSVLLDEVMGEFLIENEELMKRLQKQEASEVKYTKTAYGLFQDDKGIWNVLEIPFDPKLLVTGEVSVVIGGSSKIEGLDRFKVLVQNNIINKVLHS